MPDQRATSFSIPAVIALRVIKIAAVVATPILLYTEGATAFLNTQKALEAKAVADNAWKRQQAEGGLAEANARNQLEVARNAADRQRAEAEKAEADADKAVEEATTTHNKALNAQAWAEADARGMKAEADLRRQRAIVAMETARNAARRQLAEAIKIEAQVETKRQSNALARRMVEASDCSKPFRATNLVESSMRATTCSR